MATAHVALTGTAPMLMHNIRLADDLDDIVIAMKEITSKRTKTTEDRMELSRLEWTGGLYYDLDFGVYVPAENLFRALMNAATVTRSGKKIERGVQIIGSRFPLVYDGPEDLEGLWGEGKSKFVDRRAVTVQTSRVMRTRPIFPEWAVEFDALIDTQVLDEEEFASIARNAGTMAGIGDYRRFYGKFSAEVSFA